LGEDLYEWLLANVTPYPENATEWKEESEYALGAWVVRNGCLFESLIDCNRNDPIGIPCEGDETGWQVFRKFGPNDCANEFWNDYLSPIIALKVYAASLNYATRQTGGNGLTVLAGISQFTEQGFRSANKAELSDYKTDLIADIDRRVRNMTRWIKKTIEENDACTVPFSTYPACREDCAVQTNSKRRWSFRY